MTRPTVAASKKPQLLNAAALVAGWQMSSWHYCRTDSSGQPTVNISHEYRDGQQAHSFEDRSFSPSQPIFSQPQQPQPQLATAPVEAPQQAEVQPGDQDRPLRMNNGFFSLGNIHESIRNMMEEVKAMTTEAQNAARAVTQHVNEQMQLNIPTRVPANFTLRVQNDLITIGADMQFADRIQHVQVTENLSQRQDLSDLIQVINDRQAYGKVAEKILQELEAKLQGRFVYRQTEPQ